MTGAVSDATALPTASNLLRKDGLLFIPRFLFLIAEQIQQQRINIVAGHQC
jgi:hypothetical protein